MLSNIKKIRKKYFYLAFLVFLILSIATVFIYIDTRKNVIKNAEDQFNGIADKANLALISQMLGYTQVMISAKSLYYTAKNNVTREEWANFIKNLELETAYPGIQGIGINEYVKNNNKKQHIMKIKSSGFPEYTIRPDGDRGEYFPVIYIEPFISRNLRAFGFDVFSEPIRKEAILKARDTGLPISTGKIKLVQETTKDVQSGFIVFLPLYKNGIIPAEQSDRKNAVFGLISAVFRMNDLMQGIFNGHFENFNLEIYDGSIKAQENLMFSNIDTSLKSESLFIKEFVEEINNRTWTVKFSSTKYFEKQTSNNTPIIILVSGIVFSMLLSTIILFLLVLTDQSKILLRINSDLKSTQVQLIQSAKFAALGEMAGGVAHEINNPLTVISGKAYKLIKMAKKNQLDPDIVLENSTKIESIVQHISKITLGLLTYSRESENEGFELVEVEKILEQATILCTEKFKNNGVELIINRDPSVSKIYCNSVQISQVILNLLNNAFDAIKKLKEKWIKIDISKDARYFFFRISDSGEPIPDAVREKLMQPFFTTKKIGEGTGLGLSVSRGIIEKHNGKFYLDNEVKETVFVIVLPRN